MTYFSLAFDVEMCNIVVQISLYQKLIFTFLLVVFEDLLKEFTESILLPLWTQSIQWKVKHTEGMVGFLFPNRRQFKIGPRKLWQLSMMYSAVSPWNQIRHNRILWLLCPLFVELLLIKNSCLNFNCYIVVKLLLCSPEG